MPSSQMTQPNSALWRIRRKQGLERKQVAWILGHGSPDIISRYERGDQQPSLDNALKLSIIYNCTLEDMFPDRYRLYRSQLSERTLKIPRQFIPQPPTKLLDRINQCSYEDIIIDTAENVAGHSLVRDHVTRLAKRLAGL